MRKILFLQIAFLFFVFVSEDYGQEVQGVVKTKDGKAINKVLVSNGSSYETDSNGKFTLKSINDGVLFFRKDGFKPTVRIFDKSTTYVKVTLEEESEKDRLKLQECAVKKGKSAGDILTLTVPKKSEYKKSRDVDYTHFIIPYGQTENRKWIEGWSGLNATSGTPKEDWVIDSREINSRSIASEEDEIVGWEWTGTTKDGKSWRYLSVWWESVFYITEDAQAKAFFDRIIDNSCVNLKK